MSRRTGYTAAWEDTRIQRVRPANYSRKAWRLLFSSERKAILKAGKVYTSGTNVKVF